MKLSPEVLESEKYDALGNYEAAINQLAVATGKKDVEATTRLGKRLLIGDRGPFMPQKGAEFLMEAANAGGAEALARLSVLAGIGIYVEQNWETAISGLVAAAERDWSEAKEQLYVLSHDEDLKKNVDATTIHTKEIWSKLGSSIDLNEWQMMPDAITLHDQPLVKSFKNFISASICKWLISESSTRLSRAQVYDAENKKIKTDLSRSNSAASFNLLETNLINVLVQNRMAMCTGIPLRHFEPTTVLHYSVGEQITEHYDFVNPEIPGYEQEIASNGQRVITFLLYLNDDYTGGETAFPKLEISHKGKQGDAVFFVNSLSNGDADLRTMHAGRPTTQGEKWIVSQFIRSRPAF